MRTILLILVFSFCVFAQNKTYGEVAQAGAVIDSSGADVTRPIKSGTSLPATCSGPEMFFKTDAAAGQQLYTCAAGSWTQVSSGSGDLLAGACVSTSTQICIEDHFLSGGSAPYQVGALGWLHNNASPGGGDFIAPGTAQPGSPGIFMLRTSATAGNTVVLNTPQNTLTAFRVNENFDLTWRVLTPATADAAVRVGLLSATGPSTPEPVSGVWFELDNATNGGNNWFAKVHMFSAVQASVDMGVAPPAALTDQFQTFRIRRLSATQIGFSINGGAEQILSYTFTAAVTCGPMVQVGNRASSIQRVYIDLFRLKLTY